MKFGELGLDKSLLKAVKRSGFEEATPIQAETIPLVLAGNDVIGQAQTGTGKTAAFGLPVLQQLDLDLRQIQAVIISPTRELAIQTQEELFHLGKEKRAKVQVVYGGADIRRQIKQLEQHTPHILVGTPGRLLDHIQRGTINLAHVKHLILDEADEMLDMGFLDDIEKIIQAVPAERQTLLFSATMPKEILKIGEKFMVNPQIVKIKAKELTTDLVDQYFVKTKEFEKFDIMTRLIDVQAPELTIVFGRTKRRVDELSRGLEARGYNAAGIHGDLTQQRRMNVLRKFKNGDLDILVATDVAARGLDISGVTHVYNYDIPQDPESYVHRIGRTGRAGHHGTSVTFVTPNEMDYLRVIEKLTKKRMDPLKPPTQDEAFIGQVSSALDNIKDLIADTDTERYEAQAQALLEQYDAVEVVAAFLNNMTKKDASDVPVKITPEKPLPRRKKGRRNGNYRRGNDNFKRGKRFNKHDRNNRDNKRRSGKKNRFTIRTKKA
ncbi:DEAD/DEAH box helicase [Ligilactobacillus salivarius]|uniref:DEAD-box ATP-dependent RNA helicase CshA n=1 Tax=Ligilactobacillus salivarius TaxID=1624 RepID=A0A1Y0F901_9LACO|nr:DEAD/DEAH box helicase [Ligilactobacillus salivarius]ARU19829.1 ATP-dependent RNA helicase [Ligilactobacillus salivarius]TFE14737.1 DEAD/DEAH box helicase [Ligilactobacillus salivarius]